jgi:hypothetical protein
MDVRYGSLIVFVLLFGSLSLAVGRLLRTHGIVFLEHVFGSEGRVAGATNALLNVGYYLLSLSLLFLNAGAVSDVTDQFQAIRVVTARLGSSILVIAVIHFVNMLIFTSLHGRAERVAAAEQWRHELGQPSTSGSS